MKIISSRKKHVDNTGYRCYNNKCKGVFTIHLKALLFVQVVGVCKVGGYVGE